MTDYISTRGHGSGATTDQNTGPHTGPLGFEDVLLAGLAPDGGLYVPRQWPQITQDQLNAWVNKPYTDIAFDVIKLFTGDAVPDTALKGLIDKAYGAETFRHQSVTPLVQYSENIWLMEHFHGPTLAFKDVALQLLGLLFDYVLDQKNQRITIVGATSGDTGSAAIEACKNCSNIDIFILHPKGRVSEVQRRQMTTVQSDNVYNLAVEGTFDDCQNMVKAMFGDENFRSRVNLSAINSINWARIMAQIVYYVTTSLAIGGGAGRAVSYSVPTGNFGNIFAAYSAKQMGLNLGDLIISTNKNDILTRFFETGEMSLSGVHQTLSPSMDIQISSNFERYLFDVLDRDPEALRGVMTGFKDSGKFSLPDNKLAIARQAFKAHRCDDNETLDVIKTCYDKTGMVIDPHTAVGLSGALKHQNAQTPIINLACAHPAKFPDAVEKAIGIRPALPDHLSDLLEREEKLISMPNALETVQNFIKDHTKA